MRGAIGLALAAFGAGAALASAPGPVQAVIVTEAARGGLRRGFRALAGAAVTFASLLLLLAVGVTVATPTDTAVHLLEIAGGAVLLWIAWDGRRSGMEAPDQGRASSALPELRGVLSVAVNPGAWLFLAAVAAPLLASATERGGTAGAIVVAGALSAGAAAGDSLIVLAGGLGLARLSPAVRRRVTAGLQLVLAGLGIWLLVRGVAGVVAAS